MHAFTLKNVGGCEVWERKPRNVLQTIWYVSVCRRSLCLLAFALYPLQPLFEVVEVGGGGASGAVGVRLLLLEVLAGLLQLREFAVEHVCAGGHRWSQGAEGRSLFLWLRRDKSHKFV